MIPKYFLGSHYGARSDPVTFASFFPEKEERPFVVREEFIQAVKDALGNIREKERSVLVYHGVGGIGKTSLRKELPKVIEKHNESQRNFQILWAAVDFETEEFRQSHKFLEILRDQLQEKYGKRVRASVAYALQAKIRNKVFGECFVVVAEPKLEYVVVQEPQRGPFIVYAGEELQLPASAVLKIMDVKTNIPEPASLCLTMAGNTVRWQR